MDPIQPQSQPPQPNNSIDGFSPPPQSTPSEPTPNQFEAPIAPSNSLRPTIAPADTPPTPTPVDTASTNQVYSPGQFSEPVTNDFNQPQTTFRPDAGDTTPPAAGASVFQSDPNQSGAPGVFQAPMKPKRRFGAKLVLLIFLPILLLAGAASATYFGYIVPNSPENLWNKSLANMNVAYDKLTEYSNSLQKDFKGVAVKGSYKAEGSFNGEGTIDSSSYGGDSNATVDLKLAKGNFNVEARSLAVENSNYPDLFFKVSGFRKDSDIDSEVDRLEEPKIFDVGVDTRTKLIHKIKIGEDNDYSEFSQDYQGGDTIPFSLKAHENKSGEDLTVTVNGLLDMKANKLDIDFIYSDKKQKVTGDISVGLNTSPVNVKRPAGAISIQELLSGLFGQDTLEITN